MHNTAPNSPKRSRDNGLKTDRTPLYEEIFKSESLLIRRPRLDELIHRGLKKRLLLVTAPPGFGKTISLTQVLSSVNDPVIWHTVENGRIDDRGVVLNIINSISCSTGRNPPLIPDSTPYNHAAILAGYIARNIKSRLYLVFDGIDRSARPEYLLQLIHYLIVLSPEEVHFVITSTTRPKLRLSHLARKGDFDRIAGDDLAFTQDEVRQLLSRVWPSESSEILVPEIMRMTGGCALNLVLYLLACRQSPSFRNKTMSLFHGGSDLPFESSTILERIDFLDKDILLSLSLVPKFDIALISDIFSTDISKDQVESLFKTLPVSRLSGGTWFALSPALSDALRSVAEHEWNLEKIAEIRNNAAESFEKRGELTTAIELFLDAGSTRDVSRILDQMGITELSKLSMSVILSWFDRMSEDEAVGAVADFVFATGFRLNGNFTCAVEHYNNILDINGDRISESDLLLFVGLLYRLQLSLDDPQAAKTRDLLFSLPGDSILNKARLNNIRGRILSSEGRFEEAFIVFREALHQSTRINNSDQKRDVLFCIGLLEIKQGNYRSAYISLEEAVGSSTYDGPLSRLLWLQTIGCLHWLRGESELALARYLDALEIARNTGIKLGEFHLLLDLAATHLDEGQIEKATEWLDLAEFLSLQLETGTYTEAILSYNQASHLWASGNANQAITLIRKYLNTPLNEPFFEGWGNLQAALLLFRWGNIDEPLSICRRVIHNAEEMGAKHLLTNGLLILSHIAYGLGKRSESESAIHRSRDLIKQHRYSYMPSADAELLEWVNDRMTSRFNEPISVHGPKRNTTRRDRHITERRIRIKTFGSLRIIRDGRSLNNDIWHKRKKSKLLFEILLSRASKTYSVDEIIDILWPDDVTAKGKRGLQTAVWALRRILKENSLSDQINIEFDYGHYRLVTSPDVQIDHESFISLIARAKLLIHNKEYTQARSLLLRAIDLYTGDFLHDTLYDRFTDATRTQLFDLQTYCLKTLAEFSSKQEESLSWWDRAIQHDPYEEEVYRGYIETCSKSGLTREVLESLRKLRNHIVNELDLPMPDWAADIEDTLVSG